MSVWARFHGQKYRRKNPYQAIQHWFVRSANCGRNGYATWVLARASIVSSNLMMVSTLLLATSTSAVGRQPFFKAQTAQPLPSHQMTLCSTQSVEGQVSPGKCHFSSVVQWPKRVLHSLRCLSHLPFSTSMYRKRLLVYSNPTHLQLLRRPLLHLNPCLVALNAYHWFNPKLRFSTLYPFLNLRLGTRYPNTSAHVLKKKGLQVQTNFDLLSFET